MSTGKSLQNPYKSTSWTKKINEQQNAFGVFNAMGLFETEGVSQETITFEKDIRNVTLIPQTSRRGGKASKGTDRLNELYTLHLPYFEHEDSIGVADIQGYRSAGTDEARQAILAQESAKKIMDMRESGDQTKEFMKIEAIKGVTKDAYGTVIADMFDVFGLSARRSQEITANGFSLDFDLGTNTTNVKAKTTALKRYISKKAGTGAAIGRIEVPCSEAFFDALINHPSVKEAYMYWSNSNGTNGGKEIYRDSLSIFKEWGVTDTFEYDGILFWTYPAVFSIDQGDGTFSEVEAFDNTNGGEGYTIVHGVRGAYRGAFGPQNTLTGANKEGSSEMYMTEYRDPRDKFIEYGLEMSPLFWMAKPQLSIRCHTST